MNLIVTRIVNAYCIKCWKHYHLTLTGTVDEIIARRNQWTCSDCLYPVNPSNKAVTK